MKVRLALIAALAWSIPAAAQEADALLRKAAAAMGADSLRTLRYAGAGTGASYGQAYKPGEAWPKLNYSSYVRLIDYEAGALSEEVVRGRAEPKGGGAVPLTGEARAVTVLSGEFAWNQIGPAAVPRQAALESRQHDLWTTPHGVIKAAARSGAKLAFDGKGAAAVSFALPGVMRATAYINQAYLVERVESRVPDPVLGDTAVVTTYSDYRDFGGIQFPGRIRQSAGGFPVLDLEVKEVQPNAAVSIAVPGAVRSIGDAERVIAEQAAPGVWYFAGSSHHSVLIEMKDHLVLVEAPLYDGRTLAAIAMARRLVPGKPLRYVVNSHNHFDHSGGLRAAAAEGAQVVVQGAAKPYFEKAFANPNRIAPDALAKSGKKAKVTGVAERLVLNDGARSVEIHRIRASDHADAYLMVYLPKEKILIQADAFTPGAPNAPAPTPPNAYHLNLIQNLERLKLQVERILPLHGRIVPMSELYRYVGRQP